MLRKLDQLGATLLGIPTSPEREVCDASIMANVKQPLPSKATEGAPRRRLGVENPSGVYAAQHDNGPDYVRAEDENPSAFELAPKKLTLGDWPAPIEMGASTSLPRHGSPAQSLADAYAALEEPERKESDLVTLEHTTGLRFAPVEVRVSNRSPALGMYEIWTTRTLYSLDASLRCIRVQDLESGATLYGHECVGAELAGGQKVVGELVNTSMPLPAVGHRALFATGREELAVTSPVTRVVMHLCRATRRLRSRSNRRT